jgi:hypothetical protein
MRRAALGIIGLLLVAGGIALPFAGVEAGWSNFGTGVLIKTGAVTLLIWLAYHQVLRLFEMVPPWMLGAGLVGVGAIIAYPKSAIVVLGLFAALVALHFAGMFLAPFAGKKRASGTKRRTDLKSEIPRQKS